MDTSILPRLVDNSYLHMHMPLSFIWQLGLLTAAFWFTLQWFWRERLKLFILPIFRRYTVINIARIHSNIPFCTLNKRMLLDRYFCYCRINRDLMWMFYHHYFTVQNWSTEEAVHRSIVWTGIWPHYWWQHLLGSWHCDGIWHTHLKGRPRQCE